MLPELSAWVNSACPMGDVRRNVLEEAREAAQRRLNCHFVIGRKLTRARRPYLVHNYGAEVFVFELTDEQARTVGARGSKVVATVAGPCQRLAENAPIYLEDAEFDQADRVDPLAPITGRCTCSARLHSFQDICLRLELSLRTAPTKRNPVVRIMMFFHPPMFPLGTTLPFEFSPLSRADRDDSFRRPQTVAGFLQFCTKPDPQRVREALPLSNAHGALLTIQ